MSQFNFCLPVVGSLSNSTPNFATDEYSSSEDFLADIEFACEGHTPTPITSPNLNSDARSKQIISIGLWNALGARSLPLLYRDLISILHRSDVRHIEFKIFVPSDFVLDHCFRSMPWEFRPKKCFELINGCKLFITVGDIVPEPWIIVAGMDETIVNASNENLILGGGVSGSIQQSAQPSLQQELLILAKNRSSIGEAVITGSHGIPGIRYIIHVPTAAGTEESVFKGTLSALHLAETRGVNRLVFPALGAGTGNLSIKKCAAMMMKAIDEFLKSSKREPVEYVIKLWRKTDYDQFLDAIFESLIS